MSHEDYLKERICINCSLTLLRPHPDVRLAYQNYIKCPTCGYTKQVKTLKYDYIKKQFIKEDE